MKPKRVFCGKKTNKTGEKTVWYPTKRIRYLFYSFQHMLTNVSCYDKIHTEGLPEIFRRGEGTPLFRLRGHIVQVFTDCPFFAVGKERENRRSGYCGEQKRILYRCRLRHR